MSQLYIEQKLCYLTCLVAKLISHRLSPDVNIQQLSHAIDLVLYIHCVLVNLVVHTCILRIYFGVGEDGVSGSGCGWIENALHFNCEVASIDRRLIVSDKYSRCSLYGACYTW